ncbi:tetratricopeptide repeat protein [Planctomonas sp. JC2975]|uniref:tetratricopeptide repeat protein n=1 Tax=Planctomonas sp. JC2975 TaxID=2729626 RepID=UPI001473DCDA|nr:tetratricopeptide repeat protein [Planctomonas sp. JC2975]NNC10936.1 tetratricopeptide repeat protein [Planctomonas sp. JC2975]
MTNTPDAASLRGAVDLSALANRQAAQQPGGDAEAPPQALPGLIYDGTDENFSQFLELSNTVPVIVDLWAEWCGPCKQLSPALERVVTDYAGRFVLVKVDVDANPQLSQAFQAQSIPTVVALIGGRPAPLFVGAIPEAQVREVFEQVLQIAEQNGVTGSVAVDPSAGADDETPEAEPDPEPLPPHHQEAYDAIEQGDYDTAIAEYRLAIAQNPNDDLAVAGLAQVGLLQRLSTADAAQVREAAASAPSDVDAALGVADLDLSGGHVEDAFARLLDVFASADADGRNVIRTRLLDYFEIVGVTDPLVIKARGRLASLLY